VAAGRAEIKMNLTDSQHARLAFQHLSISELVEGVPARRMHLHPAPGKWSIQDNIAHLARYNVVFQERLATILQQDAPRFPRYNADDDSLFPQWQQKETNMLLDSVAGERTKIFVLAKSFSKDELGRTGIHPKFGTLTVMDWLEFFLLHEAHHIFTMFRLKNDTEVSA
jgi:hypothetical protein